MVTMEKEIEFLRKNDVLELVDLPKGREAVGRNQVFKIKIDVKGSV